MTTVVNIKTAEYYDVYCGRMRHGMHFGNPASHLQYETLAPIKVKTREESIQYFIDWLDGKHPAIEPERRLYILSAIPRLKDKILGCYCKIKGKEITCHADELARRANLL